ncbi:ArnT family glycosyltransferase [Candidatus Leptofilum sp.]|uniref:ArnT family glycosyltransferase n=1 Tax=Candidatus Leptofilum sp. TaxID=3241576 RepID=UPI003B5C5A6F
MPKLYSSLKTHWFFICVLSIFIGFYLVNISGWLIHDDEGTDLYEAWQLSEGKQPGIDFIAEQQPLFLTIGQSLLPLSDDSATAVQYVRLASALQVLAGAIFLAFVVKQLWDIPTAVLTFGLMLTSGLIYEQARLYRPDPMMFAWELFGFGFVLLAVKLGKRPYWAAAGIAYGIAVLMKLFGIFPVLGLVFYYLYMFIKQRDQWQRHLYNGLAFAIPFLVVSLGTSTLLYGQFGFYYQEILNQHLSLGQQKSILDQVNIGITKYASFILVNFVYILIIPLAILNRFSKEEPIDHPVNALLYSQLLAPIIFFFISRPVFPRYFIFLLPTLALSLAYNIKGLFNKIEQNEARKGTIVSLIIVAVLIFSAYITVPSIKNRFRRQETDTLALAQLIQSHTAKDEIALSDYASLNFHANRESIYEASIIAGGRIGGGVITGALLIERMESSAAKLVLVHVKGGSPSPHQLTHLIDLDLFEAYLEEKYQLIETFDRAGQIIEIYKRQ